MGVIFNMLSKTVLFIVSITTFYLGVKSMKFLPHKERRIQTRIHVGGSPYFSGKPVKIPFGIFKMYEKYDPFSFHKQNFKFQTEEKEKERTNIESPEENLVLDFSSGSAKEVQNTASKVEGMDEENPSGAFSIFRELSERVDITEDLRRAGNVTIFSPTNDVFENFPEDIGSLSLPMLRRLILRHFVRGFLLRRDMENGPVRTLGGELITIMKDDVTNEVQIMPQSGVANIQVANIETEFGLVHVVDSLFI